MAKRGSRKRGQGASYIYTQLQGNSGEIVKNPLAMSIDFPLYELEDSFLGFESFLNEMLFAVTENLAKSGASVGREAILNATTDWGVARMAGNAYGVPFRPYGKGTGRYDTGHMLDSMGYSMFPAGRGAMTPGSSRTGFNAVFGYFDPEPYVRLQELGFTTRYRFDAAATLRDGVARFKEGNPKRIPGVFAMPKAADSISKRFNAAMSAAWNAAIEKYNAAGFAGSPGKYMERRVVPRFGRASRESEAAIERRIRDVNLMVRGNLRKR